MKAWLFKSRRVLAARGHENRSHEAQESNRSAVFKQLKIHLASRHGPLEKFATGCRKSLVFALLNILIFPS